MPLSSGGPSPPSLPSQRTAERLRCRQHALTRVPSRASGPPSRATEPRGSARVFRQQVTRSFVGGGGLGPEVPSAFASPLHFGLELLLRDASRRPRDACGKAITAQIGCGCDGGNKAGSGAGARRVPARERSPVRFVAAERSHNDVNAGKTGPLAPVEKSTASLSLGPVRRSGPVRHSGWLSAVWGPPWGRRVL